MADSNPPGPQPPQPAKADQLDRTVAAPKPAPAAGDDRTVAGKLDATRAAGAADASSAAGAIDATRAAGAAPPPSADGDPLLGSELGGCRIDALLGRGAMGAVYKARQLRLDRTVAVKVIRPDLLTDRRALKRFEIEAKTVGRFNSQHVVMIHDVGFERGVHFLVMEFVAGQNLRDYTKALPGGRLPSEQGIDFLRQACQGLQEAQRLNVLHRDIKPDNLMLDERGRLKIADFGIAKPMQEDFNMTMTAELMGTPLYMSPEQCRAVDDLDYRSDLFSLGATFFYLLTGEPPVKANSVYELIETKTKIEFLSLSKVLPEMAADHPLSRVIEKMTALDRQDRYQSYDELLRDLQLVEQGQAPLAQPPKPRREAEPPLKTGGGGAGKWAAALLLLAAAGGAWWWSGRDAGPQQDVEHGNGSGNGGQRPPTPAAIDAELERVRAALRGDGPSPALQQQLAAIEATAPEQQQKRRRLQAQLDRGLALKTRIAAVLAGKPLRPELPFTDVGDYLQRVDELGTGLDADDADLQPWLAAQVTAARAERELQPAALTALLSAWAKWQSDRTVAGSDAAVVATLGPRLERIEQARTRLLALFPDSGAQLAESVPDAQLQQARQGLDVAPPPDVGARLAAVRAAFDRDGPSPALREQLAAITGGDAAAAALRTQLIDQLGNAGETQRQLGLLRAQGYPAAALPFSAIAEYFQSIDRLLQQAGLGGDAAPAWAQGWRRDARDEQALAGAAVAELRRQWLRWQQDAEHPGADGAQLQQRLELLGDGRARLLQLFADRQPAIAEALDAAALAQAGERLQAQAALQRLLAGIADSRAALSQVRSLADWQAQAEALQQAALAHAAELQRLGAPARAAAELRPLQQGLQRWQQVADGAAAAARTLAEGRLGQAAGAAAALAGGADAPAEAAALAAAVEQCRQAFAGLEREPQLGRARTQLQDARRQLQGLGKLGQPAAARVDRWLQALARAEQLTAGMVPIAGGKAKTAAGLFEVAPFFLSPTEVSQGEFAAFLDDVAAACKQAGAETYAAKLELINARTGNALPKAAAVQQLLDRRTRLQPEDLPVDNLDWHMAAAYARWRGLSLPTAAEWSLAAFGVEGAEKYPWGGSRWSNDAIFDRSERVRVTDRGPSWRTGPLAIHHLAGNVAEWLEAEPGSSRGALAGGCYKDRGGDAEAYAAGRLQAVELRELRPGQGVRTVLRLRDCFGDDWPR